MSAKYTIVPSYFKPEQARSPDFNPAKHFHISKNERNEMLQAKKIELVDARKGVYRLKECFCVRGFSARYGEELARIRKTALGALLLSETTRRPIEAM